MTAPSPGSNELDLAAAPAEATTLRFSDDLWELLERESAHQGVSFAQFVRDAALMRAAVVLDSPREECFDRLTRVAAGALGAPVALLTIVAEDRQFLKSTFGLAEPWSSQREMSLSHSVCQYAVGCPDPLVIADARENPRLRDSRAVGELGVIAYLGIPLCSADGHELGTLCVIDHRRRDWSAEDIALLRDIADAVTQEIQRQEARPRSRPPALNAEDAA